MASTVISEMTDVELRRKESELRDELFRLRFQHHHRSAPEPDQAAHDAPRSGPRADALARTGTGHQPPGGRRVILARAS